MFESLQEGLRSALKTLRGKGKLTEANMRDGLALVERSLLEADVSYDVVKSFMKNVTEQAMGQKVLSSLDPSEQLVGVVHNELINVMGPVDASLHMQPGLTIVMMCGLQGSGKTTTCGKLARMISREGKRPMLAAADLQRPAAIDQLHVIGAQLGIPVYSDRSQKDPIKVCQDTVAKAKESGIQVLILDTAGRLAIDQELMNQLSAIDRQIQPHQVLLVVDGMTGQDAVNSARAFNEALELNGVIMTKLDGDARGGAVLSVKQVTGVPIKFIGTGERLESLEPFRPEGMAGRILGMGDILEIVRTAQQEFDQEQLAKSEERLRKGEFTLDDFRKHLSQIARPGFMTKMIGLMPGMGQLRQMMNDMDTEKETRRLFGIIDSMTPAERQNPQLIKENVSRRQRIAKGSGSTHHEVNDLIKQFDAIVSLMKGGSGDMDERLRMMQKLQQGGMLDPGGRLTKEKKGTGKRLTNEEKAKMRKMREKELRRRKRGPKGEG